MFAHIVHWQALAVRIDNVARLQEHLRDVGSMLYGPSRAGVAIVAAPEPVADASVQRLIAPHAEALPPMSGMLTAEQHLQLRASMTGQLLLRQVSNATKHHAALLAIAEGGGADDEWRVVVEDDAFVVQTAASLARALETAPAAVDMLMLGMPTNSAPADGSGHPLLEHHFPAVLPHCDSYAVRVSAARRMASAFMPVRFPTQVQLWWLTRTCGLSLHMASPNQFVDGSKFGTFLSSVEVNNRLWLNIQYCDLEALLRAGEALTPPLDALTALTVSAARIQNRGHPDIQHLLARAEVLAGRHEAAQALYEAALAMYERENSPMNERSRFLLDHMALYGIRAACAEQCCVSR